MITEKDQASRLGRYDTIRRTLLAALHDGQDVAELITVAAVEAERQAAKTEQSILDNRSGSWEASLLRDMLQSGGAYEEAW